MRDKVLCIEDDETIGTLIEASLKAYDVRRIATLSEAEQLLKRDTFCALLIDIQLPDGDGLRFLARLSQDESFKNIPVLILSSHSDISNKVMAFSIGAEDFISKPFDPIELNARLTAKVNRYFSEVRVSKSKKLGDVLIDFDRQKAFRLANGKENDLRLTSIELKILTMLAKRLEQVYSRDQIMDHVWGQTYITDRTVDSHVAHLRQKLGDSSVHIETAKNLGYRVVVKTGDQT